MQIYVAAAAKMSGVAGIVYVPSRKVETAATRYARTMGAEVNTVSPGYLSVVRARAKARATELGSVVRWSPEVAVKDTAAQVANVPSGAARIVVPVGTGAIAAGIMAGLADAGRDVEVVGVAVSPMASEDHIRAQAAKATEKPLPRLSLLSARMPYSKPVVATLPDAVRLDPFYAAKAMPFVQPGDCLWTSGVRPSVAMPS